MQKRMSFHVSHLLRFAAQVAHGDRGLFPLLGHAIAHDLHEPLDHVRRNITALIIGECEFTHQIVGKPGALV